MLVITVEQICQLLSLWEGNRAAISAILKDRFAVSLVSGSERCAEGVSLPW